MARSKADLLKKQLVIDALNEGLTDFGEIIQWVWEKGKVKVTRRRLKSVIAEYSENPHMEAVMKPAPKEQYAVEKVELRDDGTFLFIKLRNNLLRGIEQTLDLGEDLKEAAWEQYQKAMAEAEELGRTEEDKLKLTAYAIRAIKDADSISKNARDALVKIFIAAAEFNSKGTEEDKSIDITIVDAQKTMEV